MSEDQERRSSSDTGAAALGAPMPPRLREDQRFRGRRKGKPLRPNRQKLYDDLLPHLAIPLPDGISEPLSMPDLFAKPVREVWMEIGFGGGEHFAAQHAQNPDVGLIGCEVFEYGVGKCLSLLVNPLNTPNKTLDGSELLQKPETVRLFPDDVRLLLPHLPDACLSRLFLLFPDPWPKTRHAKRRLMGQSFLDAAARLLRDGGELRVASDDPGYIRWSLMHLSAHPLFGWTAREAADWRRPPPDWVQTRYEQKALKAGRAPAYLIWKRKTRP